MAMGVHSSARGKRRRSRTPMAEINVTPLVDVMLVLLIIFMVTAPLLKAGVPVELPDSQAKALSEEKNQITISLSREGETFVDDVLVPAGELATHLGTLPKGADGKPPLVTLRADKALDYGTVASVMGELNHAGFNSISLVTNAGGASPVSGR